MLCFSCDVLVLCGFIEMLEWQKNGGKIRDIHHYRSFIEIMLSQEIMFIFLADPITHTW